MAVFTNMPPNNVVAWWLGDWVAGDLVGICSGTSGLQHHPLACVGRGQGWQQDGGGGRM